MPLRLDEDAYPRLRQHGLLYSARLGIRSPGGYQIRAAVQDDRSKAIGTSAQFVEVPKVGKDLVALSGILMMDVASAGSGAPARPGPPRRADRRDRRRRARRAGGEDLQAGHRGRLHLRIYDGRGKRKDGFSTRATLLRDGKAFYTTPPAPVGAAPKDVKPVGSVPVGGKLSLGRGLPRGTYTLQVSVAPQSGKGRDRPRRSGSTSRCDDAPFCRAGVPRALRASAGGLRGARPAGRAGDGQRDEWPTFRAGVRLATVDAVVVDGKAAKSPT